MKSIISYPERGPYGKNNYRGNCSGYIIRDLINHFAPKLFVDATVGSGTSHDVCREMNVDFVGLDIHTGFDSVAQGILPVLPRPADTVFSHPPYHTVVNYELERQKHGLSGSGNDLSTCLTVEEFLEKSFVLLMNQREATRDGGIYSTLIGDMRKSGAFHSFQSDYINMMPKNELVSVAIKLQHNCFSEGRQYSGNFIPIQHEYLLIWKRKAQTLAQIMVDKCMEYKLSIRSTWRTVIRIALMNLGGEAALKNIYEEVCRLVPEKSRSNNNIQAKIRQTLQLHYTSVQRGVWAL